jgi:oligo-1,6-glucosidase
MEDVELLILETHRRGLKIILDIALNHTAWDVSIDPIRR